MASCMASVSGPWSEEELKTLRVAVSKNMDVGTISDKLGRTRDSVYQKAKKLGLLQVQPARPRERRKLYHNLFGD